MVGLIKRPLNKTNGRGLRFFLRNVSHFASRLRYFHAVRLRKTPDFICLAIIPMLEMFRKGLGAIMAIYKLIANGAFGPDEINVMTEAYEGALIDLDIPNRNDPITELIAKSILNVTATGERNPIVVKEGALNALGVSRPSAA